MANAGRIQYMYILFTSRHNGYLNRFLKLLKSLECFFFYYFFHLGLPNVNSSSHAVNLYVHKPCISTRRSVVDITIVPLLPSPFIKNSVAFCILSLRPVSLVDRDRPVRNRSIS